MFESGGASNPPCSRGRAGSNFCLSLEVARYSGGNQRVGPALSVGRQGGILPQAGSEIAAAGSEQGGDLAGRELRCDHPKGEPGKIGGEDEGESDHAVWDSMRLWQFLGRQK